MAVTPQQLAVLLRQGQQMERDSAAYLQPPRQGAMHWTQGLAGVLGGVGGNYLQSSAARQEGEQQRLAAELLGEMYKSGDASAAMQNPWAAEEARKYQAGAGARGRAQASHDMMMKLRQAQIDKMSRSPQGKFFNTPSGVVMISPDGTPKLVYQDPAAAAKAEMIRGLMGPGGQPAPQGPTPQMQPMADGGAPMQPTLTGDVQPGPVANPTPQAPPQPAGRGPMGLSPEARKALGISQVFGDRSGAMAYSDLTRGRGTWDNAVAKEFAKEYADVRKRGATAKDSQRDLIMLTDALADPNVYTGTAGQTVNALKKAAQTLFGLPVKGVSTAEIIDKTSKRLAIGLTSQLDLGRLSDGDREFLQSIQTGLNISPEGNRRLAQMARLHNQFQVDLRDAMDAYVASNGRLDANFAPIQQAIEDQFYQGFSQLGQAWQQNQEQPRSPLAGVPKASIDYLMNNPTPDVIRQFDEKYGSGASGNFLGGAGGVTGGR